ncbi:hypothetical protein FRB91_003450 [Serendipita sp. 411]|nr:hypothetical protein FRB91_003450 [Serendipita sp. 411]KAG9056199.1 hypothetical protein FS842_011429 [Serendipita sp. 407]
MPIHIVKELYGKQTEVLIQKYADRTLILVTQMGKVGSLIQASVPTATPFPSKPLFESSDPVLPEPPVAIALTPLMGTALDERSRTMTEIYVSQIATLFWCFNPGIRSPVVVGLALKREHQSEEEDETSEEDHLLFREMMKMIGEAIAQSTEA